jgi:Arc/MetJ family transcription regulator
MPRITIDNDLLQKAMEVSKIDTQKGVVEQAIREFVSNRTRKDLRDLVGKIRFADGYDPKALRRGE